MSQTKPSSKWGSFFQQAVAGVESRLDTILADGERPPKPSRKNATAVDKHKNENGTDPEPVTSKYAPIALPGGRHPGRLQERLAKAVESHSPAMSVNNSNVPTPKTASPRPSLDEEQSNREPSQEFFVAESSTWSVTASGDPDQSSEDQTRSRELPLERDSFNIPIPSKSKNENVSNEIAAQGAMETQDGPPSITSQMSLVEYQDLVEQLRLTYDAAERQKQEDENQYLEQIENLQAKLQFMAQEASSDAKRASAAPGADDVQQLLAQKEEKLALLVEEGLKLSRNELKLRNSIKKLKSTVTENEKSINAAGRTETKLKDEIANLRGKMNVLETAERENANRVRSLDAAQLEIHRLRVEAKAKDLHILELEREAAQDRSSHTNEEAEKWRRLFDTERKTTVNLREDMSNLKIERDIQTDRHKTQLRETQAKLDQDVELRKVNELNFKRELQVLESRMETYRTRAEEISSEGSNDVQAKLIRQVETIQNSYSVASENWKGIESSLLSRIAVLEKEQAEFDRKESDMRRKTREVAGKSRELELQLGREAAKAQDLKEALSQKTEELSALQSAMLRVESELDLARVELKTTKEHFGAHIERLERKQPDGSSEAIVSILDTSSTVPGSTVDYAATQSHQAVEIPSPGLSTMTTPFSEVLGSGRTSEQPPQDSLPYRQNSTISIAQMTGREGLSPMPGIRAENHEQMFDGIATPITPERTINDVLSTSTAGAGPSVQLVERMSAAVRRLETEKAALKDEIDRLSIQRDEARNQVISLMQETESGRATQAKNESMKAEVQELNLRLHTTLEMLGEKSELVEELRADIADMKEIYRATLEDTVK